MNLLFAIIDLLLEEAKDPGTIDSWLLPLEVGAMHWLREGLALFLTRYGAGIKSYQALIDVQLWLGGIYCTLVLFPFKFLDRSLQFHTIQHRCWKGGVVCNVHYIYGGIVLFIWYIRLRFSSSAVSPTCNEVLLSLQCIVLSHVNLYRSSYVRRSIRCRLPGFLF